ncbi:MAG: dTDP-4-dehydrorhamnose 3,5-epimerase [Terriglobales bacterium]
MNVSETQLPDLLLIEPKVFKDSRGYFLEIYNEKKMAEIGIREHFVQDNLSCSSKNVLRGLHYQIQHAQGKLVRAVHGEIFDVAVDLRANSPAFGKWYGTVLSEENNRMLWIPPGMAHGFEVLSGTAQVLYKATDFYYPEFERTLAWNDPKVNIEWRSKEPPIVSSKDALGSSLQQAEKFE